MKTIKYILISMIASFFFFSSCYYDKGDKLYPHPVDCDTSNSTYSLGIKPILDQNCVSCHNSTLSSGGVNLESYNTAKAASTGGKLFNSVNHSPGAKSMPPGNKLPACSILKIETWVKNGTPQ